MLVDPDSRTVWCVGWFGLAIELRKDYKDNFQYESYTWDDESKESVRGLVISSKIDEEDEDE